MATNTTVSEFTGTLTGTTQDVLTVSGASEVIEVINRHATEDLWIKWGSTDPGSISIAGAGTRLVLARQAFGVRSAGNSLVFRILGNGNQYTFQTVAKGNGHQFAYQPYGADVALADGGTGASDAPTARTNLGLAIGANVEAWSARLDQLAAITPVQGDIIFYNGTAWVKLVAGANGTKLTSNGPGTSPTWV